MSYTRQCNKCGDRISLRQMPQGQWVAFDVSTEESHVCGIKNPKVSLLNLGEEKTKGNLLTQAAYTLMADNIDFEFIGNCEGRDIFNSKSDVIVCDGFTGNIVLKEAEGIYTIMKKRGLLDNYFKRFNYENYGGTPILGLNKPLSFSFRLISYG